jgi:hypothetical protein
MTVIEPIINCPLHPYPGENRTPLGSCVLHCPNFKGFNEEMQVVCKVDRKVTATGFQ